MRIPKIVVKKVNKEDISNIKERVTHFIIEEKSIQTRPLFLKNENEIIINCMNEHSAKVAEKLLQSKLSSSVYMVQAQQLLKPKIKVVGIGNYKNMDINKLEDDINNRNFDNKGKCQILHKYKNGNNGLDYGGATRCKHTLIKFLLDL